MEVIIMTTLKIYIIRRSRLLLWERKDGRMADDVDIQGLN